MLPGTSPCAAQARTNNSCATACNAAAIFGGDVSAEDGKERIGELQAKIGQLTMENDFLEGALGKFPGPSGKR